MEISSGDIKQRCKKQNCVYRMLYLLGRDGEGGKIRIYLCLFISSEINVSRTNKIQDTIRRTP